MLAISRRKPSESKLHLSPGTADRIPFGDIGLVLGKRVGKHMAAGAVRYEIERPGRSWIEHGRDAVPAGIRNRPLGKAWLAIGVVAGYRVQFRSPDPSAERFALGDRIDDGRIGIELHADPEAVAIDACHHPPQDRHEAR